MLIALQFPLTDLRRFVDTDAVTARLRRPAWPAVEEREFLRAAGDVQRRDAGGSTDWTGEELFCGAHRAVRLPGLGRSLPLSDDDRFLVRVAFRRFFADKACVRRLEIGFSVEVSPNKVEMQRVLRPLLNLNIRMPSTTGTFVDAQLHDLAERFGSFYLGATTGRKSTASAKKAWVEPGEPIVVVETEPATFQKSERSRVVSSYDGGRVKLWHDSLKQDGGTFTTWTIERDRTPANLVTARDLRINLLRWHAEQQSMRKVVRAIASQTIRLQRGSEATDNLDDYLNERIPYLERPTRGSTRLKWSDINEVAREATDSMSLVQQRTLLSEMVNLRKNIRRKARAFVVEHMDVKEVFMGSKFGKVETGGGNFNYAEGDLTNVGGDQYNAGGDIQVNVTRELDRLDDLIKQASGQAAPADAAKIAAAAAAVREEATKQKPDEGRFRVTAKGLLDAAKAVAGIAAPVAATVKTIYELLFSGGWPF